MEKTNEMQTLIEVFKKYRELLSPIQTSLQELAVTYGGMEGDIKKISDSLNGDAKKKLTDIHNALSMQSQKTVELSTNIDKFLSSSNKYISDVDALYKKFEQIQNNITTVNELDNKARAQIEKLEEIIEEKKLNYNLKDLQRILENYNNNVQKVSDFINKDVAANLAENNRKIDAIKKENEMFSKMLKEENSSVEKLINTFETTNTLLRQTYEKETINEEYVFELLDKWANLRGVKIKK